MMAPRDAFLAGARLRPLLALLQLASPSLPVGGYAYSQGLETAIDDGLVRDGASAQRWIEDGLRLVLARYEAPMFLRVFDAWARGDDAACRCLNDELLATRETQELRAESRQMGLALVRLFPVLGLREPDWGAYAYPAAYACACAALGVGREDGLAAYLWAWLENQVLVAVKTVPLGQSTGQRMLVAGHDAIVRAVEIAAALGDDELGTCAYGLAMASARHETQYSRLFRS